MVIFKGKEAALPAPTKLLLALSQLHGELLVRPALRR